MSDTRTPVRVFLSKEERKTLDQHAQNLGMSRGEMMRRRALCLDTTPAKLPQGPDVYADALEAAARAYSGLPRVAMAGIVSAVILSLSKQQ